MYVEEPHARAPSGSAKGPRLTLDKVGVRLDAIEVLRDVSCQFRERRIAIVGRNGSGKTTLARVIAGLQTPTTGSAKIDGADMARDRKAALSNVGILFQNPEHQIIFPTVTEEIAFGLVQQGHTREVAARLTRDMLKRFGKSDWEEAVTHQLSQGQKQLVCLMAVLAMQPKLIVLDEPYSGLDIPTRMQLMRYVDGIDANIVQITHDPDTVAHFDRIVWLDKGAVRMDGPATEVRPAFERAMQDWGRGDDLTDLTS